MSQPSSSRRLSYPYSDASSIRSSTASNPNVFSDDYALEPVDSRLDLTLQNSTTSGHTLTEHDRTRDTLNITPYPAIPSRLSGQNRPNSISKRTTSNDTVATVRDGATERTLSTSSRFSFVRSQSPYSGPTQPSHPYSMYPQITRASSIASESTIRPNENPFVPTDGPEHPYSLYAQNTMPEDDAEDIGTQAIPLGFPRLGLNQDRPSGTARSDVGDIIGTDGHVEQLPPYTRYADNVIAKGDMANIDTSTITTSRRASQRSTLVAIESRSDRPINEESSEREILLMEEIKKETWREKAQRRVCGGSIALWLLILIGVLVLFAGIIGGVIGGVVGRRQGKDIALSKGAAAAATATVVIDADPASTNSNTPACPTGKYTIPLNQTQEINNCVADPLYGRSWDCLDIAFLGITISDNVDPKTGNKTLQVSFNDYSVDTSRFLYGPQPPDFNGSSFDLTAHKDRDNEDLGVAMFFYKTFDKLSIIPDWAFKHPPKRSIDGRELRQRNMNYNGKPLERGAQPWYCFWNSTINEFFIFLEKPIKPTTTWSLASTATPMPTQWNEMSMTATKTVSKRGDTYTTPYYPQYPQLVKMVEKRAPEGNIAPYCQRMQVLDDWSIVPNANNQILPIEELQYADSPVYVGPTKRWQKRHTITEELESNCVCEWLST